MVGERVPRGGGAGVGLIWYSKGGFSFFGFEALTKLKHKTNTQKVSPKPPPPEGLG